MTHSVLIAGGGIAGLACAVSLSRAGWQPRVCERAPVLAEVGAGVQLGPNVTRILRHWQGEDALRAVAFEPTQLVARSLQSGTPLAVLSLRDMSQRYGAPYLTVHRADLHALLLRLAQAQGVPLQTNTPVRALLNQEPQVIAHYLDERPASAHAWGVVADGVWSQLRQQLLHDGAVQFTGHVAYRALVLQSRLPAELRSQQVTVWMGPQAHVVHYPVRGGEWLNVVCLVEDRQALGAASAHDSAALQRWQSWNAQNSLEHTQRALTQALQGAHRTLLEVIHACDDWRLWPLCGRAPMQGAHQHAQGRIALVGDAAHPMLPYLAQGAGMALEDAQVLGQHVPATAAAELPQRLQAFAQARWQRNARVQQRAFKNGRIFHATGPLRLARDLGLRTLGASLMDVPWLYGDNAGRL